MLFLQAVILSSADILNCGLYRGQFVMKTWMSLRIIYGFYVLRPIRFEAGRPCNDALLFKSF